MERTPTFDAYQAAIRRIYERGLYRFDFCEAEFLTQLALVDNEIDGPKLTTATASTSERAAAALAVLARIIDGVGPELADLMGSSGRLRRRSRTDRLKAASKRRGLLSMTSHRYYREAHLPEMLTRLADTLFRLEERAARQRAATDGPTDALAVEWLRRHEYYSDLWTPIWAVQADLVPVLNPRRSLSDGEISDFKLSALYWWGMYWIALANFREDCHGIWVLADPEAEQQVTDAIYEIGIVCDLQPQDQSWLRIFLRDIDHQEFDRFRLWLPKEARGLAITEAWFAWVATCRCGEQPEPSCKVHHAMARCLEFTRLIDEDWYEVAGWYRKRPVVHDGLARYAEVRRLFQPKDPAIGT